MLRGGVIRARPDKWADGVNRRADTFPGQLLERGYGVVLHPVEGVDDEAIGEDEVPRHLDHERVRWVGAVLYGVEEVGTAQRHAPG